MKRQGHASFLSVLTVNLRKSAVATSELCVNSVFRQLQNCAMVRQEHRQRNCVLLLPEIYTVSQPLTDVLNGSHIWKLLKKHISIEVKNLVPGSRLQKSKFYFCLLLISHTRRNFHMLSKVFCKPSTARSLATCYHGDRDPQEFRRILKIVDYLLQIWATSSFWDKQKVLTKCVEYEFTQKSPIREIFL